MGTCVSRLEARLLLLGLGQSGKTTFLYQLTLGEIINTVPTIGFNVETFHYNNVDIVAWDVGGQSSIRTHWRHYYTGTQGLIYMIDSTNRREIKEDKNELHKLFQEPELKNVPILIFANKQDVYSAMSTVELVHILELTDFEKVRWNIVGGSVLTGQGVLEGLDWLVGEIKKDAKG